MVGAVQSNHAKLQLGRARAVAGAVNSNHAKLQLAGLGQWQEQWNLTMLSFSLAEEQ